MIITKEGNTRMRWKGFRFEIARADNRKKCNKTENNENNKIIFILGP